MEVLSQQAKLPEEITSPRLAKIINFFKPDFRFFAAFLLLFSLFFVICLIITQIDKAQHSYCGFKCGFLIDKPRVSNPLDYILTFTLYVLLIVIISFYFLIRSEYKNKRWFVLGFINILIGGILLLSKAKIGLLNHNGIIHLFLVVTLILFYIGIKKKD